MDMKCVFVNGVSSWKRFGNSGVASKNATMKPLELQMTLLAAALPRSPNPTFT